MTDNEIIKASECCKNADCQNCPRWSEEWCNGMFNDFLSDVLDLINRYKAEIERLQSMNQAKLDMIHDILAMLENAKSEARKEFAEGLDEVFAASMINSTDTISIPIICDIIKDTLEELECEP